MNRIPPPALRRLLCVLGVLLCLSGLVACDGLDLDRFRDEEETEEKKVEPIPVEVATLERGEIEAVLRFSTNLEAEADVEVYSQASRLVTELLVEEGDRVDRGEILVRLQSEEQESEVARTEIQLRKARREYERQESLFERDMISEQTYRDAEYEVERLELALEDARRKLSYTVVRAPIGGTVTRRLVNLGDNVQTGQHLFDIVDFDTIVARVFVPERDLARLEIGQPVRIYHGATGEATGDPDPRTGRVIRIAPVVDPKSGTVKVTVGIPRNQELTPGMYVEAELVVAEEDDALLVPKRALVFDDVQSFVYRIREKTLREETLREETVETVEGESAKGDTVAEVERLRVRPVMEDREWVVPAPDDGLAAGDRVVVAGQAGLEDGAAVRLVPGVADAVETDEGLPEEAGAL